MRHIITLSLLTSGLSRAGRRLGRARCAFEGSEFVCVLHIKSSSKAFSSPSAGGIAFLASAEVPQHLASALLRSLQSKFIAVVPSVWIFCSSEQWGHCWSTPNYHLRENCDTGTVKAEIFPSVALKSICDVKCTSSKKGMC